MIARTVAVFSAVVVVMSTLSSGAFAATAQVAVRNNYFDPAELRIEPGDTVSFTIVEGTHTITADDGSFDSSESFSRVFEQPGEVPYHCKIHGSPGAGMHGTLYVGVEPPPPPPRTTRVVGTDAWPTIASALIDLEPNTTIELPPGRYPEAAVLSVPGTWLRGTGADPSAVVIDGEGRRSTGVAISSDAVMVEGLTVRGFTSTAVIVDRAETVMIRDVITSGGAHGVRLRRSRAAGVRRIDASDAAVAAFSVTECETCGTVIEDVVGTGSAIGFSAVNASGVILRQSRFVGNGVGVSVASDATRPAAPHRGVDVVGVTVEGSAGAGISVNGGWSDRVLDSSVTGGRVGVEVTGVPIPSNVVRVAGNRITGVDGPALHWDLVGVEVCFAGNVDPARPNEPPSSEPPALETLAACRTG